MAIYRRAPHFMSTVPPLGEHTHGPMVMDAVGFSISLCPARGYAHDHASEISG